ncbi:MAG: hypothetical protein HYX54_01520 [Chloroflexi bacterium]|nr:hypothetical protein [Chloroflexota bacterium]
MAWDQDLGDQPDPSFRHEAPDLLSPIDATAPVSGHHPPASSTGGLSQAPEQDWLAAEEVLFPVLRPVGTPGTRVDEIDPDRLAAEGLKSHGAPILEGGPCGLTVGYVLRADSFDVHVNADHLLAWGASPAELRAAALANLTRWSANTPWTEEVSGERRLLSSASGDGNDVARILLPEVREHIATTLGAGVRVLVGIPERDLLVAGALSRDDEEFAVLFAEFIRGHADDADLPLDRRVLELVSGELHPFEG